MTGRKKVTSVDVARLAGVSQSTVSRIFTPSDIAVSADTRQKVLTAAETLGYKPNAIARSLTTRRTNIIGLIMSGIDNPFYPYLLGKFTQRLQNIGLHILLFNTEYMQDSDEILARVLQYQVDGLIVTAFPLSLDLAHECRRDGIPVVLFNQYAPDVPVSAVCCDIEAGGRVIADLLLDSGFEIIAFISGPPDSATNNLREKGFTSRLKERGRYHWLREQGDYTYKAGYSNAIKLLSRDERPDVIFCSNDVIALGAIDAARHEFGLHIPDDLSIIGFDDIPTAGWAAYTLTTFRQPYNQMADIALKLLLERLESPEVEPDIKFVPGSLVQRSSAKLVVK